MVEDYHNRKMAKKKRKRDGQDERPEGKRVRSKKNKTRRICRGLCYQDPFEVRRKGQALAAVKQAAALGAAEDGAAPPKAKRRRKQKPDSPLKQSTSINLLASSQTERTKPTGNPCTGTPDALLAHPQAIQQYMLDQGLTGPTPVQERSWPVCLDGKDVQAVAEPGSGKTLAYLLPGIPVMCKQVTDSTPDGNLECCPAMLVLAPTRELAQQIAGAARPLKKLFGLSSLCLYGGVDKQRQIDTLKQQQPQLLVATPGRLLDLIDDEECPLTLEHVKYVVLDEADKMLSLGLQPQLKRIRAFVIPRRSKPSEAGLGTLVKPHTRRKRPQVLLFTATMPETLQEAAAKWQRKPVIIHLAPGDMSISKTVSQVVQVCAEHKKPAKLLKHLTHIKDSSAGMRMAPKVLVFANRIKTVRFLQQTITEAGFKAMQLHGDKSQAEREEALLGWKCGKAQVLVATDVAARGLHIKNLPYVINYDFPTNLDTYIHRVGRTGRLATDGHAYSFFTRNLAPVAKPLLALLKTHDQAVDPNLVRLAEAYEVAATAMQNQV
ncbi:hypothetical protein ABBQ32_013014 [Trebouxia sp. C0010 RCD-2024]